MSEGELRFGDGLELFCVAAEVGLAFGDDGGIAKYHSGGGVGLRLAAR